MSGFTGRVVAIALSMGVKPDEWHQRTGVIKRATGLYDLYPAYPDAGTPTQIQFVVRPYQSNNATVGVTPEALLVTVMHHLDQPDADEDTRLAVKHIEQALALLHAEQPTEKD
jgi:hypothetical protein